MKKKKGGRTKNDKMKRCSLKKQIGFLGITLMLIGIGVPDPAFAEQGESTGVWTYISSSVPYELEGRQEPPATAVILLNDERTGRDYERELPRMEVMEKERVWKDDFFFSLTVSGYDADIFLLGDTEIPADADLSLYGDIFLEYLGLSEECYRVNQIEWNSKSYERDGTLCRDAVASGEKLVRYVDVKYGGQVRLPDVPEESEEHPVDTGKIVEMETEKESVEETITVSETENEIEAPAIRVEERETWKEKIGKWIREHLIVVTVSLAFLVILILTMVLLIVSGKKKKSRD